MSRPPLQLDRAELGHRFGKQAADLIIQIASLLQGGALSAAAFSLIGIFQTGEDAAIRVMLWLISVILSLVMFFRLCQRALFVMRAGAEIVLMLPVMCLLEVILFAIVSTTELGAGGWRYWYVAGAALFIGGVIANASSLRSLAADQFADELAAVYEKLRAAIRRECIEGIVATLFTASLGLWLLAMPARWPFAVGVVAIHLALTMISSVAIVRRDTREVEALRAAGS